MSPLPAITRTVVKPRHALIAPDGHVAAPLPGWRGTRCVVLISPAMGARFTQMLFEMEPKGEGMGETGERQVFFYVLSGAVDAHIGAGQSRNRIPAGGYAYFPSHTRWALRPADGQAARVVAFEKFYEPADGVDAPGVFLWNEREVPGQPFLGDPDALLQVLLPDRPEFDMAINVFRYKPGARLPFVETHVMEHGLLMLAGEGIYRLGDDWYPVAAGDVIWMAAYCPQWFAAIGKSPAAYLYYKDVNRPILPV